MFKNPDNIFVLEPLIKSVPFLCGQTFPLTASVSDFDFSEHLYKVTYSFHKSIKSATKVLLSYCAVLLNVLSKLFQLLSGCDCP